MRFFLLFFAFFWSFSSFAGLDEVILSTKDKSCSIHYLASYPKKDYLIKVDKVACKDGWVHGFAEVEIYSPKSKITETISGYFMDGYWLDSFMGQGHVVDRTSPDEKIQAITFLLEEDKEAHISYYAQLRATQIENRSYSAFEGCPDFRLLVVVPKISVFKNEAFQEKIIQQGLKFGRSYCSNLEILAFFGATRVKNPDIQFQMQLDVETGARTFIPIKSEKQTEKEVFPAELKYEKSDMLLSVEPSLNNTLSVDYKGDDDNSMKKKILFLNDKPFQNTSKRMVLGDLMVLSRVAEGPVLGKVIVHIAQINLDGTAMTDLPDKITLQHYPNLKVGWAEITGILKDDKMQVSGVTFCQKEWCQDVP